jgi:hypothetical protein
MRRTIEAVNHESSNGILSLYALSINSYMVSVSVN